MQTSSYFQTKPKQQTQMYFKPKGAAGVTAQVYQCKNSGQTTFKPAGQPDSFGASSLSSSSVSFVPTNHKSFYPNKQAIK